MAALGEWHNAEYFQLVDKEKGAMIITMLTGLLCYKNDL
jgi:hypothetical protein